MLLYRCVSRVRLLLGSSSVFNVCGSSYSTLRVVYAARTPFFLRAVDLLTVYVLSSDGDYFARRASVAQICCIRCVAARVCWQLDH